MRWANGKAWLAGVGGTQKYVSTILLLPTTLRRHRAARRAPKLPKTLPIQQPSLREKAVEFVRENGTATTKQLQAIGVHRCYLSPMCGEGVLVRVSRGLYIASAAEVQDRLPKAWKSQEASSGASAPTIPVDKEP